ncbi:MAG TPA: hypothetical protein VIM44_00080 [Rariglobus sp.]
MASVGIRAEQSVGEQPAAPAPAPAKPAMGMNPQMSPGGPQSMLTEEEREILNKARTELQNDPELAELTNQIKALVEKRTKLAEEKFAKISPEAAAILKKIKDNQEKMQAERRAQMEAMQAKHKAEMEAKKAAPEAPASTP